MDKINGQKLKEMRIERGLSIRKLAELAGVNKSTIMRIEKGEMSPTIDIVEKILAAMSSGIRIVHEENKDKS